MTPEEFAAQTGLSLEEAEMVLARRAAEQALKNGHQGIASVKLRFAREILSKIERKVGVKPYEESK